MNKHLIQFLFVALLLAASAGCAENNNSNVDPAPPVDETPVVPTFLFPVDRVILHSASYTIIDRNPSRALSDLQRAVEESGGYVDSASSWSGEGSASYASLSATVPPESLSALSEAISKIADQIQNQSVYVQDVTSEILKLQRRHHDLTQAQDQILLTLVSTKDPDRFSTYGILRELLDTELESVESQLESYEQQARLGTFDVTINQPASLIAPIE
jgi:hypothetical protein